MAGTSSEISGKTLVALARALRLARLEAIVIGNSASMLNGAPVTTQDIDLLIRDTRLNRRKLARFADAIGGAAPTRVSELGKVESIEGGLAVPVAIHYDRIAGGLTFSSIRSRAQLIDVGGEKLRVAELADVIRSKEAANRRKDRAVLPILRDTLAVRKKLLGPSRG
jgi:predicted nucleotidyltransferase